MNNYKQLNIQCQAPCSKCQKTDSSCTECISLDRLLKDYKCVCFDGYGESGNGCAPCLYPCEKSSTSVTTCTSCIDTGQYTLSNNKCICGYHFYQLDNQCHQCSPKCKTCINYQDNCLSCSDINHIFLQNDCFCSPGYYTGLSMECIECNSPYSTCIINTDYCTSCVSELYNLIDNQCECIDGYYFDSLDCQQCKSICTKCKTLDLCQECIQGYYFDKVLNAIQSLKLCNEQQWKMYNICSCQIGYYEDQYECIKCPYPCIECNDSKICIKCDELPLLYQNNDKCLYQQLQLFEL